MLWSRTTCSSKIFKYPFAVLAETPTSYILMVFFVKNAVLGFGLGLGFNPTLVPRFTYSRFRNTKKHPKYLGFLLLTVIAGLKTPLPRGLSSHPRGYFKSCEQKAFITDIAFSPILTLPGDEGGREFRFGF